MEETVKLTLKTPEDAANAAEIMIKPVVQLLCAMPPDMPIEMKRAFIGAIWGAIGGATQAILGSEEVMHLIDEFKEVAESRAGNKQTH